MLEYRRSFGSCLRDAVCRMRQGLPPRSGGSARPWQRPDMLEKFATMKPLKYASNGLSKKFGKVMLALACGSSLVIAPSGAIAQTADSNPTPSNNLNIPPDVTLFGKSDPNVRKATAIINGEIIRSEEHTSELQSLMSISYA